MSEDLLKRILYLVGALIVFRLGTHIVIPFISQTALASLVEDNRTGILGMMNMFSGGALERLSIFTLNSPVPTILSVFPNEEGNPATIPAKIIIEIPFPIPFSLICSPSHIKNKVPVVNVTTVTKLNVRPGFVTNATPPPD